ncbi:MAG: ribosomal protein S18-alanine N-acetyltransferase [Gordonibacter sp.]|uniref:ribosomal protein S18-alanine N-acetyltransferase n=1 Tax=Gordonibacter sp. TaxID=1968902 RepID=UPI002FCC0504
MSWGRDQIAKQAVRTAHEDYAAFEAIGLAGRSGVRVLDVGCFDGINTRLKFAPYAGVERVVGIDPLPDAVARARAGTDDGRFAFLCSSLDDFDPGGAECFDLVYFSQVLQHLPDPQAALQRAFCLLAPGGFVIVKTVDDAAKLSYPDPGNAMRRLFALYEQHVLPHTPHTACTDRYNGRKCYTLMKHAGFGNVAVRLFQADTAGKSLEERRALFERCVYFRRNVPACVDRSVADEIGLLVDAWGALFEQGDYYFCSQSFVAIAQKLSEGGPAWPYAGPMFAGACAPEAQVPDLRLGGGASEAFGEGGVELAQRAGGVGEGRPFVALRPLAEADLGAVMGIEIASFRDPWTPLAFALDLRHNPQAHYRMALCGGRLAGYAGWWDTPEGAVMVRIAVDPVQRGVGVGRALVEQVVRDARKARCEALLLEVRAANEGARAFYARLGFEEACMRQGYYHDPPDDGIVMVRPLS